MTEDSFAQSCRRQQRIRAFLQSYGGERVTTAQICDGLRIEIDSAEHISLISMLVKMNEYQKIGHERKSGESVWWIEPRREIEPPPAFNLRYVKAVARSKVFS